VFAKSRRENGKVAYAHVQDIRPFVNKPPPLVQRPSTVGGLDKRAADNYWRAYKPRKGDGELCLRTVIRVCAKPHGNTPPCCEQVWLTVAAVCNTVVRKDKAENRFVVPSESGCGKLSFTQVLSRRCLRKLCLARVLRLNKSQTCLPLMNTMEPPGLASCSPPPPRLPTRPT
jgi:hypothetical protein